MSHPTDATNIRRWPTYVIGSQETPGPLVSPEQVKGYLRLLRAFHNLRITVEDCKDHRIPGYAMKMDKDGRWRWFVHLAIDRFEGWVRSLQFVPLEKFVTKHLPPLDVWMVWHAYLLSPCWYAEDCERLVILKELRLLNMLVVGSMDIGKIVRQKPSSSRATSWHKQTGTPFDPFEAMSKKVYKEMECPRCRTQVYAPSINDDGTGFAQERFSAQCPLPGCRLRITKENLAVAKFVRDLTEPDGGHQHYIAGSLFAPSGNRDVRQAKVIKGQLIRSAQFAGFRPSTSDERLARLDWVKDIKEYVGYSLERLKEAISNALNSHPEALVSRILSAYTDGSLFSIDLVGAVLRQCFFTQKMDEIGWIKPGAFSEGDKIEILEQSVVRYHAFLDLMTAHSSFMPVPTLDIDLVWHTHQLMANRYGIDCEMYVGRYVNHELSVAESHLSSAFDDTCRAWQTRYQVPYMQCGCPLPPETSLQKFMRFVRQYMRGRSNLHVLLHPDHLLATHPSVHNAVPTAGSGTFGKTNHHKGGDQNLRLPRQTREGHGVLKKRSKKFDQEGTTPATSSNAPPYSARELDMLGCTTPYAHWDRPSSASRNVDR
ncbi:hypothetical protein PAXRUDRAFT_826337 [Paxillus rubicundulus Ve08.2h10]|uniref:Uncharacterized protein n=1 Tax=Paxillus rubicundulus Ve08.2h10 TaxID=930991 RepID=A0A0D0DS49_9AGAM|nr:hypothetical protein PAXRUDRAFT_826337 [Paxillus rubicundulus Ve08.2h10]